MDRQTRNIGLCIATVLLALAGCAHPTPPPPHDLALGLESAKHRSPRYLSAYYCGQQGKQAQLVAQGRLLWYYRCVDE